MEIFAENGSISEVFGRLKRGDLISFLTPEIISAGHKLPVSGVVCEAVENVVRVGIQLFDNKTYFIDLELKDILFLNLEKKPTDQLQRIYYNDHNGGNSEYIGILIGTLVGFRRLICFILDNVLGRVFCLAVSRQELDEAETCSNEQLVLDRFIIGEVLDCRPNIAPTKAQFIVSKGSWLSKS
ncbi:MAG: hypothetical protein UR28_C0031G0003 [Candidatus Peregrinibacteria bacterium GW2011_GWF2_33_10]|nr:MAG: hypothetical protein UR28_C0031G0003 [Candidatus Peregrinibacteria bacterium GW2011_GWF2_33_10]OGJ44644.1 MAG: hypothetical protein A2263_00175 [Candidatus Peregrinibacteria bacterium RIFOXYA2_FULL_33_21]OGJ46410.1 MAG: hypothetical protein A2272_06570 [Candidatus Peregrinibacteria bacterium RIFOXYA12_FULL_33_12]